MRDHGFDEVVGKTSWEAQMQLKMKVEDLIRQHEVSCKTSQNNGAFNDSP